MSLQVFQINDCEWWAADGSPQEVLAVYLKETGLTHEEATGDVDEFPVALTDEALDRLTFVHDDDGNDLPKSITFRAQLAHLISKGTVFPCFFATTEW